MLFTVELRKKEKRNARFCDDAEEEIDSREECREYCTNNGFSGNIFFDLLKICKCCDFRKTRGRTANRKWIFFFLKIGEKQFTNGSLCILSSKERRKESLKGW